MTPFIYKTVQLSENVRNPNVRLYNVRISVVLKVSENRTNLFGFQTLLVLPKSERYTTERSVFGQTAKLDRFTIKLA